MVPQATHALAERTLFPRALPTRPRAACCQHPVPSPDPYRRRPVSTFLAQEAAVALLPLPPTPSQCPAPPCPAACRPHPTPCAIHLLHQHPTPFPNPLLPGFSLPYPALCRPQPFPFPPAPAQDIPYAVEEPHAPVPFPAPGRHPITPTPTLSRSLSSTSATSAFCASAALTSATPALASRAVRAASSPLPRRDTSARSAACARSLCSLNACQRRGHGRHVMGVYATGEGPWAAGQEWGITGPSLKSWSSVWWFAVRPVLAPKPTTFGQACQTPLVLSNLTAPGPELDV